MNESTPNNVAFCIYFSYSGMSPRKQKKHHHHKRNSRPVGGRLMLVASLVCHLHINCIIFCVRSQFVNSLLMEKLYMVLISNHSERLVAMG